MTGYGIKRGKTMLCWAKHINGTLFKAFLPILPRSNPVIFYSAYEVDNYVQELMTELDDYSIVVHKFSEEELAELLIRKLRGH
jgi:hypothetical protein